MFKAFAQGNARTALRNARAGNARSASRQEGFLFSSRGVAAFSRFGAQGTEKKGGAAARVPRTRQGALKPPPPPPFGRRLGARVKGLEGFKSASAV